MSVVLSGNKKTTTTVKLTTKDLHPVFCCFFGLLALGWNYPVNYLKIPLKFPQNAKQPPLFW